MILLNKLFTIFAVRNLSNTYAYTKIFHNKGLGLYFGTENNTLVLLGFRNSQSPFIFTKMRNPSKNLPNTKNSSITANVPHNEIVQNLNNLLFISDVKSIREDFNTLLRLFVTHKDFKDFIQDAISNILFTVQNVIDYFSDAQLLINKSTNND